MTFEELKDKALSLPFAPGVYIMRDAGNKVIYVGKAKKLKNRVSQYFQDSAAHTPKTRAMVSKIDHFDVIVAASEFEALVLECSLIKRYLPKYNILLKDDKGYPYLRLDMSEEYPRITVVHKLAHDGAAYFGPYGSWGVTQHVLHTILRTLKLPNCSKQFPRDLGKDRPCLNYHMNQCQGWCQLSRSPADYRAAMEQARLLLTGNYQKLAQELGVTFYDQQLIPMEAQESGLPESFVRGQEKHLTHEVIYDFMTSGYAMSNHGLAPLEQLFAARTAILRRLAASDESFVIVGRCADYILYDDPNSFRVFVHAAPEQRVQRIQDQFHTSPEQARRDLEATDRGRSWVYKQCTGRSWGDGRYYNLAVDSGKLGIDGSVELILNAIRVWCDVRGVSLTPLAGKNGQD